MKNVIKIESDEVVARSLKKWIGATTRIDREKGAGLTEEENIALEELYILIL